MRVLERITSDHNEVEVWQSRDGSIDIDVIGATHATWHPERLLTGHAWDAITAGVMLHPSAPRTLLMLGLGGGTVLRQVKHLHPQVQITAVEIDPDMVRIAREYMHLDDINPILHVQDAFAYLDDCTQTFDVVIDDLYRSGDKDVERPCFYNETHLNKLRRLVSPSGVLISNFVIGKGHRKQHMHARGLYAEAFEEVRAIRPPLSLNEILVGARQLRPIRQLKPYHREFPLPSDQKYWKELSTKRLP